MNLATPPRWADWLLRQVLPPADRHAVSGDLLEEYRERIYPARGAARANRWYVRQVAGIIWREHQVYALLLAAVWVGRFGTDLLFPPTDFSVRSALLTWTTIALFAAAGGRAAWRTQSIVAAAVAGLTIAIGKAGITTFAALMILALWHDDSTMAAVAASGGVAEVFTLPLTMIAPGVVLSLFGGLAATAGHTAMSEIQN
jgi:hypothetical protein